MASTAWIPLVSGRLTFYGDDSNVTLDVFCVSRHDKIGPQYPYKVNLSFVSELPGEVCHAHQTGNTSSSGLGKAVWVNNFDDDKGMPASDDVLWGKMRH